MKLITQQQEQRLIKNGETQAASEEKAIDFFPVVKLFIPDANATWLLTGLLPNESNIAFGLCDVGLGFPELGYVSLEEIKAIRGRFGLPVERDLSFKAKKSLSAYAKDAQATGQIMA